MAQEEQMSGIKLWILQKQDILTLDTGRREDKVQKKATLYQKALCKGLQLTSKECRRCPTVLDMVERQHQAQRKDSWQTMDLRRRILAETSLSGNSAVEIHSEIQDSNLHQLMYPPQKCESKDYGIIGQPMTGHDREDFNEHSGQAGKHCHRIVEDALAGHLMQYRMTTMRIDYLLLLLCTQRLWNN
jgi:hypothetical protein